MKTIGHSTASVKAALLVCSLCLLLLMLNGCNDFFVDENGGSGGGGGGTPRFAYVSNFNNGAAGSVSAFTVNSSTGALTAVAGSPFSSGVGNGPVGVAAAHGNVILVANEGGGVSSFQVNRNTGALAGAAGSPFAAGDTPAALATSPDGNFVYISNRKSSNISGFRINSANAALTSVGTAIAAPAVPGNLAVDATSRFLYVTMGATGTQLYSIASDGALTSVRTVPPSPCAGASAVVTDSNSRFAFIPDGVGSICTYAVNASNGDLLLITSSPVATGAHPVAVAITPDNKHLYVANLDSDNVSAYSINPDGTLTGVAGSPFSVGDSPTSLAVDPSGKFLYVTRFGESLVSVFSIASSGALTQASTISTGLGPSGIVVTQ